MRFKLYNKGFSLIELMFVMLISLLVFSQLHHLIVRMSVNYEQLDAQIEQVEGQQIALIIFKRFIDLAGYAPFSAAHNAFKADSGFAATAFIHGEDNVSGSKQIKAATDVIKLRFVTPEYGQMRDCKNTLLKAAHEYVVEFYIDKNSDLRCKGAASSNQVRSSAVLAHAIDDLQIEYGYKVSEQISFCSAACIENNNKWAQLIAIRFKIRQQDSNKSNINSTAAYTVHTYAIAHAEF